MKVLTDCDFWWGFCIFTFIVVLSMTVTIICVSNDIKTTSMAKKGYEQVIVIGTNELAWKKVKN